MLTPKTPLFDITGIWRYKGIFFSRHGTLKENGYISCKSIFSRTFLEEDIGLAVSLSPRFIFYIISVTSKECKEKNTTDVLFISLMTMKHNGKQVVHRESVNSNNFFPSDSDAINNTNTNS